MKKPLNKYRKMRARWPEDWDACCVGAGPVTPAGPPRALCQGLPDVGLVAATAPGP